MGGGTEWGKITDLGGWSVGNITDKAPQNLGVLWTEKQVRCLWTKLGLDDAHWREKKHLLLPG